MPDYSRLPRFALLCLLCALTSGGLLAGIGPLQAALVREKYFEEYDDTTQIYPGAFNIMTVFTCFAGLALEPLGPRTTAMSGLVLEIFGNIIVCTAKKGASAELFLVSLGMVGGGGNALWLSAFPIAHSLYNSDGHGATAASTLSSMWNFSGLVYIVLSMPKVTIANFFFACAVWNVVAFFIVAFMFPRSTTSSPLVKPPFEAFHSATGNGCPNTNEAAIEDVSEEQVVSPLTLSDTLLYEGGDANDGMCSNSGAEQQGTDGTRRIQSVEDSTKNRRKQGYVKAANYAMHEEESGNERLRSQSSDELQSPKPKAPANTDVGWTAVVKDIRLWWFLAAFSSCTLFVEVLAGYLDVMAVDVGTKTGQTNDDTDDGNQVAVDAFTQVGYPIISNCCVLLAPCFGRFVDASVRHGNGLARPMVLLLAVTQITCASCFLPDLLDCIFGSDDDGLSGASLALRQWHLGMLYITLVLLASLQATVYPMMFVYPEIRFPSRYFGRIIAMLTAAQATAGLIAYPGLSPNPFGDKRGAYRWPLLLAILPSLLCWRSPWLEMRATAEPRGEKSSETGSLVVGC